MRQHTPGESWNTVGKAGVNNANVGMVINSPFSLALLKKKPK